MAAEGTPAEVRQAAAVNFKNHVKRHWNGTGRDVRSLSDGEATVAPIPDSEKVTLVSRWRSQKPPTCSHCHLHPVLQAASLESSLPCEGVPRGIS